MKKIIALLTFSILINLVFAQEYEFIPVELIFEIPRNLFYIPQIDRYNNTMCFYDTFDNNDIIACSNFTHLNILNLNTKKLYSFPRLNSLYSITHIVGFQNSTHIITFETHYRYDSSAATPNLNQLYQRIILKNNSDYIQVSSAYIGGARAVNWPMVFKYKNYALIYVWESQTPLFFVRENNTITTKYTSYNPFYFIYPYLIGVGTNCNLINVETDEIFTFIPSCNWPVISPTTLSYYFGTYNRYNPRFYIVYTGSYYLISKAHLDFIFNNKIQLSTTSTPYYLSAIDKIYILSSREEHTSVFSNYVDRHSGFYDKIIRTCKNYTIFNENITVYYVFESDKNDGYGYLVGENGTHIKIYKVKNNEKYKHLYLVNFFDEAVYLSSNNPPASLGACGGGTYRIYINNTLKSFNDGVTTSSTLSGRHYNFIYVYDSSLLDTITYKAPNCEYAYFFPFNTPLSTQLLVPNITGYAQVFIYLQNAQNCENYVINVFAKLYSGRTEFLRNMQFDAQCSARLVLKPYDTFYKFVIYDKNGNLIYQTGSMLITQGTYYLYLSENKQTSGTVTINNKNVTFTCKYYDTNTYECSVLSNQNINAKLVAKKLYTFYNNTVCEQQNSGTLVALSCLVNRTGAYNIMLFVDNVLVFSEHLDFTNQTKINIEIDNKDKSIILVVGSIVVLLLTAFNPYIAVFSFIILLVLMFYLNILTISNIALSSIVFLLLLFLILNRKKLIYE